MNNLLFNTLFAYIQLKMYSGIQNSSDFWFSKPWMLGGLLSKAVNEGL